MEQLLKTDATYCWNEECNKILVTIKKKMASTPILVFPKWEIEFYVHVDASCIALATVLTQEGAEGIDHPIAFASRQLSKSEKNYSTTECPDHLSRIDNGEEPTNLEEGLPDAQLYAVCIMDGNFEDIVYFLTTGTTPYVPEFERGKILTKAHGGVVGGYYVGCATTQKILHVGLWWPTLHQDSKAYCRACNVCQWMGKSSWRDEMLLKPQMTLQPFEKWEIDFVGPITPPGKTGACYIITATEYLTQWVEAQAIKDFTTATTVKFLFKNVLTWFGCPKILMRDHGKHFLNETISALIEEFQIYHQQSTPYHP
eukprot:PITA_03223